MTDHGIHDGFPEQDYHAHPSLSRSGAKTLLSNPARYRWEADNHGPSKDAFDVGTAAHAIVLGVGLDELDVIDATDWRTKASQEAKKKAHREGRTPLLRAQFDATLAMAEAVLAHPTARLILEREGQAEQTAFWTDQADDGTPVECRARFDYLTIDEDDQPAVVDLKTTGKDAGPTAFVRSILDYGYELQDDWYSHGFEVLTGQRPRFTFVVVEKDPPHFVAVHTLDDLFRRRGRELRLAALNRFAYCTANNDWPAHGNEIHVLTPPRWAA
jgi:hypothetical protein